jgi:predicted cupin superfamily sugar epimerase
MPSAATAERLIAALGLKPLPGEGGFFRATSRTASLSSIYFLMTPRDFSALHRIAQDEVWHFYGGDRVEHVQLTESGGAPVFTRLGPDILGGDQPQLLVPAGVWQGARLDPSVHAGSGFALIGCTVGPPWDERGFELAQRDAWTARFPQEAALIRALTR